MKHILLKPFIAIMVAGLAMVTIASAHSETTGNEAADHRIAEMKKMGANLGAIAKVVKGEAEYSDELNKNAQTVAAIAADLPKLFPEGSGVEASRSKPEIWEEKYKADFQKDIEDLQAASNQLVAAVQSGDKAEIGAALKMTGGACGGCHKQFRKPKE
ncbi:cytochrome c [Sneathiella sp.]|uniref:c-type cytochrome n=1 Tax=Sneathiella sp. TaxID=1964365 RepID=UPI00356B49C8